MKLNECSCGCGGKVGSCSQSNEKHELESYMFMGNLQIIKRAVDALLEMDPMHVDAILNDGHDWAADHIATSKDDIQEVADFFINKMMHHRQEKMMERPFVHTFESYITKRP